jgi:cell division septation protein DedD
MKSSATIISICLTAFLLSGGCSREEPPPVKSTKVVRPIKRPAPKKAEELVTEREEEAKDEAKDAEEVKTAAVEKQTLTPPEKEVRQKEKAVKEVAGYYIVKEGESLSGIASRGDVYRDPLKWPFLYRRNLDKLSKLPLGQLLPDSALPEGLRLKIVSPDEVRQNLRARRHKLWVVNVVSTTTNERINPFAANLITDGYLVYITRVKVKGRDWTRLRVGFFKDRTDADRQGERIMAMLNLTDSWVTKVDKEELEKFGGY